MGRCLKAGKLWVAGRRATYSTHLFRECERLWSADTFVDFNDGLETAGPQAVSCELPSTLFIVPLNSAPLSRQMRKANLTLKQEARTCTATLYFDRFGAPFESMPRATKKKALQVLG